MTDNDNKNDIELVSLLEQSLGYTFKNKDLALHALTHRSWIGDFGKPGNEHSETLEFLGDAVIDLAIATLLMKKYPQWTEGELTKNRAFLVNQKHLSEKGMQINLGELLRIGRGEEHSNGRVKPSILSDAFEAVFGAVYSDSGFNKTLELLTDLFQEIGEFDSSISSSIMMGDFKSILQEMTQATYKSLPEYRFIGVKGPEHNQQFLFEVTVNEEFVAEGSGKTKKSAQQEAARLAIELIES
jgi:ribonuclease III